MASQYTTIDAVGVKEFNELTAKAVNNGFFPIGQHVIYQKHVRQNFQERYVDKSPGVEVHFTQMFKKPAPKTITRKVVR